MKVKNLIVVLILIFVLIAALLSLALSINSFTKDAKSLLCENLKTLSDLRLENLEDFYEQRKANVIVASKLPNIEKLLEEYKIYGKSVNSQLASSVNDALETRVNVLPVISQMYVAAKDGVVVSSNEPSIIGLKAGDLVNRVSENERNIIITEVVMHEMFISNTPHIDFILPIYSNDEYLGVVVSSVNLEYYKKLVNGSNFAKTGSITILSLNGDIIETGNQYLSGNMYDLKLENTLSSQWEKIDFDKNPSGFINYSILNVSSVLYYVYNKNLGLIVLSSAEWSDVMRNVKENVYGTAFVIMLITILFALLSVVIVNWILKPLKQFSQTINEIYEGNDDVRFNYEKPNEFGEIAKALNTLMNKLMKNQLDLKKNKQRYEFLFNSSGDIVCEWDLTTNSAVYSDNFNEKFEYEPASQNVSFELLHNDHIHDEDKPRLEEWLNNIIVKNVNFPLELRMRKSGNQFIWVRIRCATIYDENYIPEKLIVIISDIDREKHELLTYIAKSQTDMLTKLYNKVTTETLIEECIAKTSDEKISHALFIIDFDNFKAVNDTFGHFSGDDLLRNVSTKLKETFRIDDIIGRIGGDEFVVFLKEINGTETIGKKAREINKIFKREITESGITVSVSCSIGIAVYNKDGKSFSALYRNADSALYQAKKLGKDRYVFYDESF